MTTLGNLLLDVEQSDMEGARDNLVAFLRQHYTGGIVSAELDAFAAMNRLADKLDYDDPDLVAIRDWLDPIPAVDDRASLAPAALFDLLTRLNTALVRMDSVIHDAANRPIARTALAQQLLDSRPPAALYGELGAARDAARRAKRP